MVLPESVLLGGAPVDHHLDALSLDETLDFVRGFMLFSMLANLAEDRQGVAAEQGADVAAALERLAAHLGDTLGASVAREARTIQFDGSGFSGTVTLENERVMGEIRLGLMMRPLKGVITREIEAGLDYYLAD